MNELTIALNLTSKIPLYEQIYLHIKDEIKTGYLENGRKLPSTRALAHYLEVSRSTVELAYEQLVSEGYIESKPCRGYYVAQIEDLYHFQKDSVVIKRKEPEYKKYEYDFSLNGIELNSFPYNVWRKLYKEILMDDNAELFCSGDAQGEYGFRSAICNYLHQARGVNCTPDQVIVGAGSDYLFMLLGMLLGKNITMAFEDPAYKQAYHMAKEYGYHTVPVRVDRYGMNINELEDSRADVAYVTPSHQYPTGIVMPVKRRQELIRWAYGDENRYIIEDDYDSEFRYKGRPIPALQGYGGEEKVIYLGTFSKSIAPALRMGYMILPKRLMERFNERCRFISSTVSKVDQMIVQKFIEDGHFERNLNRMRALYKVRHDVLLEELKPLEKICKVSGENAGVHILLTFDNGKSEEELIQMADEKGIKIYGLSEYFINKEQQKQATVILGYAILTEEKIRKAVTILKEELMQ